MRMYDIILKKRNGERLSDEEIGFFIDGYTRGEIPDYQASALCMAICLRGMDDDETAALTYSMARSGDMLDLSRFGELSSDKHSTGGVGDKTSLIVGPIAAALGAKVTKMSGRGLGHTGGTVDKLESIPGMRMTISREEFLDQCDKVGLAIIGQSGNMTPADKKLYAIGQHDPRRQKAICASRRDRYGGLYPPYHLQHHVEEARRWFSQHRA